MQINFLIKQIRENSSHPKETDKNQYDVDLEVKVAAVAANLKNENDMPTDVVGCRVTPDGGCDYTAKSNCGGCCQSVCSSC